MIDDQFFQLNDSYKSAALDLAEHIVDACGELPTVCGVAALISVTGSVCFNEAEGDYQKALKRAEGIAAGVRQVIDKLHQNEEGNGHEDGTGVRD